VTRNLILAVLLSLLSTSLFAQTPYTETVEVRLHNVDVIVTDSSGNHAGGLRSEDFEIFEDGKPQAVTNFAESTVTVQVEAAPLQAPPHPVNALPPVALAVSVTVAGTLYASAQSDPQTMAPSYEVTMPLPILDTSNAYDVAPVKLATTVVAAFTATMQLAEVPEQAPPHPVNVEPVPALACRMIVVGVAR